MHDVVDGARTVETDLAFSRSNAWMNQSSRVVVVADVVGRVGLSSPVENEKSLSLSLSCHYK